MTEGLKSRNKEVRRIRAGNLIPDPLNWHLHGSEQRNALTNIFQEVGFVGYILVRKSKQRNKWHIIDGHERVALIIEKFGLDELVDCAVLDVTEEEAKKILATHDAIGTMGTVDEDILAELLSGITFDDSALSSMINATLLEIDAAADEEPAAAEDSENPYTTKVTVPPYEITEEKPPLSSVYDSEKCDALLEKINASDLPEDEKHFLRAAAYRHVVFNFRAVANYYAHSEAEVQQHFEDSALVLVDMQSAITNGSAGQIWLCPACRASQQSEA